MSMVTEAPLKNAVPTDQELIDFVVREARLIDQQRFDEWLNMYADDAFYWMPLEWNQTDPRLTCSLMYEDKLLLSIRVERLKGARTFSQKPKSRCHHVLQTPQVDSRDAATNSYVTWTPIHYVETRLDFFDPGSSVGAPLGKPREGNRALMINAGDGREWCLAIDTLHGVRSVPVEELRRLPPVAKGGAISIGAWLDGDQAVLLVDLK